MAGRPPLWLEVKRKKLSPEKILRALGVVHPPVDVFDIARRLGVHVWRDPTLQWSGAIDSSDEVGAEVAHVWIKEGPGETPERQRFTLAHELGHLILHPAGLAFRDTTFAGDIREAQANGWAANLLMPFFMMDIAVPRFGAEPHTLARLFQVSPAAMKIRLAKHAGIEVQWSGNL
jgi:hypothetical protein